MGVFDASVRNPGGVAGEDGALRIETARAGEARSRARRFTKPGATDLPRCLVGGERRRCSPYTIAVTDGDVTLEPRPAMRKPGEQSDVSCAASSARFRAFSAAARARSKSAISFLRSAALTRSRIRSSRKRCLSARRTRRCRSASARSTAIFALSAGSRLRCDRPRA